MAGGLLERDAHNAAAISEFAGAVPSEQMGEIPDRHLPLEGHAAAPGRVGARAPRRRLRANAAAVFLGTACLSWAGFQHLALLTPFISCGTPTSPNRVTMEVTAFTRWRGCQGNFAGPSVSFPWVSAASRILRSATRSRCNNRASCPSLSSSRRWASAAKCPRRADTGRCADG